MGKVSNLASVNEGLLDVAVEGLRCRLPESWKLERIDHSGTGEVQLFLQTPGGGGVFLVEVVDELRPRDVQRRYGAPLTRRLRSAAGHQPLLVVAPELSVQTRAALRAEKIGYLDGTGNMWLQATNPSVVIDVERPLPKRQTRPTVTRGLSGAAVGRVMRVLIDGLPPATLDAVARAAKISLGYCSKVAATLTDEDLVIRTMQNGIEAAAWPAMIRRRAETSLLFRPHATSQWAARSGVDGCLERLATSPPDGLWCVTGSHAAARYAPVTAPRGLTIWVMPLDVDGFARHLDLLPVDKGGDVRLVRTENLTPFDRVGDDLGGWWERPADVGYRGVRWAAPSQAAIDCLSGTGRMPEEGDALLEWMMDHEAEWRRTPIGELPPAAGTDRT